MNSFALFFLTYSMYMIEINELKKKYDDRYVLKGINAKIEAGQLVGYIGPNGAGKSTTIKIICGLIPHFYGEVKVMGMDVRKEALTIKQHIGYIPEQAAMYDVLTPLEYLRFIGKLYGLEDEAIKQKSMALLRLFELDNNANQRMETFSKGMRQKVLLTSGLIHNPDIIFFDEPLSGLDANAVILIKEILSQLKAAGKTIFYSSHIMDVVEKICDRIIIIDNGNKIADDSFANLQTQLESGTLENIFTKLTGDQYQYHQTAKDFLSVLNNK